jgi:hypothetical protein
MIINPHAKARAIGYVFGDIEKLLADISTIFAQFSLIPLV